jgi:hypothetical protein
MKKDSTSMISSFMNLKNNLVLVHPNTVLVDKLDSRDPGDVNGVSL